MNNRYDEIINDVNERVGLTLKQVLEGYSRIVSLLKVLHDNALNMSREEFVVWLNMNTEKFDVALKPLDEVLNSWPEFIGKQKEEDNGNDTQIQ